MEGNVIFKTSTRGFNKKEVINYITEISARNAENAEENERLRRENAMLTDENVNIRLENGKLANENSALSKKIEDLSSTIASLNSRIDELNAKAEKMNDIEGAEEKANKLMMDSLRYSESCIKNARKVTASINHSTKKKINKAKDCLNMVSGDFKSLTDQIEASISEMSERLVNLSDGLDDN